MKLKLVDFPGFLGSNSSNQSIVDRIGSHVIETEYNLHEDCHYIIKINNQPIMHRGWIYINPQELKFFGEIDKNSGEIDKNSFETQFSISTETTLTINGLSVTKETYKNVIEQIRSVFEV
ncbi:hypothetical protein NCTGTJJY_CDS0278 [Serratia phage 92A1]|nr:hypothetical protein NCTGTJJY_CDS0278 [Serratia phage 92A1]